MKVGKNYNCRQTLLDLKTYSRQDHRGVIHSPFSISQLQQLQSLVPGVVSPTSTMGFTRQDSAPLELRAVLGGQNDKLYSAMAGGELRLETLIFRGFCIDLS